MAERQFLYLKDEAAARQHVRYLAARGAEAVKVWYIVDDQHTVEASAPLVKDIANLRKIRFVMRGGGPSSSRRCVRRELQPHDRDHER